MIITLSVGVVGGILFFPFNFQNEYTCIFHRFFSPGHSHSLNENAASTDSHGEILAEQANHNHKLPEKMTAGMEEDLVNHYVVPFGLVWWGSLLLIAISLYGLKRIKVNRPLDSGKIENNIS